MELSEDTYFKSYVNVKLEFWINLFFFAIKRESYFISSFVLAKKNHEVLFKTSVKIDDDNLRKDLADLRGLQPQIFPTNLKTEKAWVKNGFFFCYHIFISGSIHNSPVLSEVRKYYKYQHWWKNKMHQIPEFYAFYNQLMYKTCYS